MTCEFDQVIPRKRRTKVKVAAMTLNEHLDYHGLKDLQARNIVIAPV